jgi:2',3'-cyclic-nucleotide 2'-phosphodiesterase (5'-nucleotidase family)
VAKAMQAATPQADVVVMNAGSIRVDDIIPMPVTEYDIIRAMPFGGGIREVDMKGSLLAKVLDQGRKNVGIGGYLIYNDDVSYDATTQSWKVRGTPIDEAKTYRVALTDYLLSGKEANMNFLNEKNPDIIKLYEAQKAISHPQSDIRLAFIRYLETLGK